MSCAPKCQYAKLASRPWLRQNVKAASFFKSVRLASSLRSRHNVTTFQIRNARFAFRGRLCQNATFAFKFRNARFATSPNWPRSSTELGSPHPNAFEASSLDTPATHLRDYLTQKRNVHQITPQCCCEWHITAVLSEYPCSSYTSISSVFNWLSAAPASNSVKRSLSRKKKKIIF